MTTTVQSFNAMLKNFIHELTLTFPEDQTIAMYYDGFDTLVKANARKPLELFMNALSPHAQYIMTKDPALFAQPLSLGADLDLKAIWEHPDLSQSSKDAIWQYLQSLFLLATTVSALPPDMLNAIENLAQECAGKIQNGETDFASVTQMLMGGGSQALSSLLGGGSANPLASLLSPPPSSSSGAGSKSSKKKH